MKSFIIPVFSILILLMLGGCQTIETRGQFIDNTLLSQLETRKLNKLEVKELIGSPTIIPDYSPNNWYYIERTMSQRAWFNPKVEQQRIVKVTFNNNLVQEVTVINDSYKEDVEVIREYTKTYGTELNGLQKFVKNFGRFNATTKSSKKKK
ncbi:outer membrane protein assembly factor BamE [Rickettsia endosymbiont of Halotydeus destructor]|uniref:outer membrane protein assembly factor BamE n=1 Tax=Rickettsia endosymbiont of Halotydeus destructor TaxID=2996754 RepID=UPI003BAF2791